MHEKKMLLAKIEKGFEVRLFIACALMGAILTNSALVHANEKSAPVSISQYFMHDKLIVKRHAFFNADNSQRVEYHCEDENGPGGENEGANNPANGHCEATLFLKQFDEWVFSDEIKLRYGSVKKFAGHQLVTESLDYSSEDALCCPSVKTILIFNTESGKLIEDKAAEGKTSLIQAIQNDADSNQIANDLIKGANINAKDANGQTALTIAVKKGKTDIVKLLLDHEANVNVIPKDGKTALIIAADNGAEGLVRLLLDNGANINEKSKGGRSALDYAIWNNKPDVSRLLLEKGADVNSKDANGWTALMGAAWYGRDDLFLLLLEKGADVNARDGNNQTALWRAVSGEHPNCKIVRLLLDKGADANERLSGDTLLMRAAGSSSDDTDCMQALLEKGVDINARSISGWTALFNAASAGNLGNVEFLIRNGADPDLKASMGETAISTARNMGRKKVVQFLESRKAH